MLFSTHVGVAPPNWSKRCAHGPFSHASGSDPGADTYKNVLDGFSDTRGSILIGFFTIKQKRKEEKMTKNGLIAMGVMVVVITVSGRIIGVMNQRSTPRYDKLTRAESLLYDEDYKAWLENVDVSSFDARKVKNADNMFQIK